MYLGPLRWPSRGVWLAVLALTVIAMMFAVAGIDTGAFSVAMIVVVLLIAAPRRARDLGAEEMRRSRPEE